MREFQFDILPSDLLQKFCEVIDVAKLAGSFHNLADNALSSEPFSFYTSVAAVYSSKIEGEGIELASFM